ncbi:hypothetical protein ACFQT0_21300 [Hymenobacter humi]|uniref:Uncharacterized protein n=1 Tax=Hymenobacter humi TaxID=1411620 RepID=A0ABW2UBF2_9BACT
MPFPENTPLPVPDPDFARGPHSAPTPALDSLRQNRERARARHLFRRFERPEPRRPARRWCTLGCFWLRWSPPRSRAFSSRAAMWGFCRSTCLRCAGRP